MTISVRPSIADRKKQWYFEAKDKWERSTMWCLSLDGSCRGKKNQHGVFVHWATCTLVKNMRDYAKYAGVDPQQEIGFGDAQEPEEIAG